MPLAKLPYTHKITARATDGNGCPILSVQILDGNGVVRGTLTVAVGTNDGLAEMRTYIQRAIEAQMIADAGSRDAWLAGVIAGGGVLPG